MGKKITNSDIERFPGKDAKDRATLWDAEVRGFGLRWFKATGAKTFILQYRVKDSRQERIIKIGRYLDPWKVDQARAKALELKAQMVSGVDPVEEERRAREEAAARAALDKALGTTLKQVLEHYLTHKRTKHGALRSKTKADLRRHCEQNLTSWLDQPVAGITRGMCLEKLTEITDRGAPAQATQCMIYLRALLNHAKLMHETPDGQYPVLASNPVTALFRLHKPHQAKARTRRIPMNHVGHVWNLIRERAAGARTDHERTAADYVSTLVLTGWRATECASLKKTNVDLEAKTITLHGDVEGATDGFEGTKTHATITLPMSDVLCEIMTARINPPAEDTPAARRRKRKRATEYVFPSFGTKRPYIQDPGATMREVSKVAGCHLSPHDLRRTAESIAKAVKVDGDDRRKLLNHAGADVHAQHYDNESGEALRPAVNAIAKFIVDAATVAAAQERGENVIAFPGKPA